jgi:NADH-quinone oxidoreductase subunit K
LGPITLGHYLSLGAILFALSVIGIFLNRKNLIVLLMAIELMAAGGEPELRRVLALPGRHGGPGVRVFILTVAARRIGDRAGDPGRAGFRNRATINVDELDALKG